MSSIAGNKAPERASCETRNGSGEGSLMVSATYDEFYDALFARHENRLTSALSTVGDAVASLAMVA